MGPGDNNGLGQRTTMGPGHHNGAKENKGTRDQGSKLGGVRESAAPRF